jgi:hypothetical protein
MSGKPVDEDNEDRKPGLGGRQGNNELQPKKLPGRLSSNKRTNPITEKESDRDEGGGKE